MDGEGWSGTCDTGDSVLDTQDTVVTLLTTAGDEELSDVAEDEEVMLDVEGSSSSEADPEI